MNVWHYFCVEYQVTFLLNESQLKNANNECRVYILKCTFLYWVKYQKPKHYNFWIYKQFYVISYNFMMRLDRYAFDNCIKKVYFI